MKKQDKQALKSKTIDQLQTELKTAVQELVNLRLELKTGQLKDLHSLAKKRRQIALIKTLITQNSPAKL
jgi:large subunit ribosomal protein L29